MRHKFDAPKRGYSPALAEKICEALAAGRSLKSICTDKGMPCLRTTHRWLAANAQFQADYALARDVQAQILADEVLEIADDTSNELARARLRIGARKWKAGILSPVKYGSKFGIVPGVAPPPVTRVIREIVYPKKKDAG